MLSISIWCNNMVAGDEYEYKVYEKTVSGGTASLLVQASVIGVQDKVLVIDVPGIQQNGWEATLKRLAGSDHAFTWSVNAVT